MTNSQPTGVQLWILGARLRTLPAAIMPVMVGSACAGAFEGAGDKNWTFALLALVVSLALQVGVNYANDYSDGVRGTDEKRVGPLRLVGSGLVAPQVVKRAAFIAFGVAAVFGLVIALATSLWLVVVGAACIGAGWLYTGGPKPYGYMGLGELFVFVFFGLVATCGTDVRDYAAHHNAELFCIDSRWLFGCCTSCNQQSARYSWRYRSRQSYFSCATWRQKHTHFVQPVVCGVWCCDSAVCYIENWINSWITGTCSCRSGDSDCAKRCKWARTYCCTRDNWQNANGNWTVVVVRAIALKSC